MMNFIITQTFDDPRIPVGYQLELLRSPGSRDGAFSMLLHIGDSPFGEGVHLGLQDGKQEQR